MSNKQNWFSRLFNRKSFVGGPVWVFNTDGTKILISDSKGDYMKEGFGSNSVVYSIIRHISDKFASLPFYLYEVKDSKQYSRYKAMSRGLDTGASLIEYERTRKKALREVDRHEFLDTYNKLGFDGKAQLCGFRDIAGEAFLWKIKGLSGGAPLAYKILPSQFMAIHADATLDGVRGYRLNLGQTIEFTPEEIAHWKYWNPFFDNNGGHLYGLSPLRAAYMDLMTSKAGKNAAYSDFANNGTRGAIVRNEDIPWQPEQKDDLRQYIDENFNGVENRGKIRAINIKAEWMQMGLSSSEMETMKALQLTKEDICNVYQFPVRLLAGIEGTFNNVESSGKQLITNCIMPRALSHSDFVDQQLLTDFDKPGRLHYGVDITALPELQDEMAKMYELMEKAYWVNPDEKREMTNWEASGDPNMKKFYFPSSLTPLDQLNEKPEDLGQDMEDLDSEGIKDYK
jgi:HK97 family phage portal protein